MRLLFFVIAFLGDFVADLLAPLVALLLLVARVEVDFFFAVAMDAPVRVTRSRPVRARFRNISNANVGCKRLAGYSLN